MVCLFADPVAAAEIADLLPTLDTFEDIDDLLFAEFRFAQMSGNDRCHLNRHKFWFDDLVADELPGGGNDSVQRSFNFISHQLAIRC